MPKAHKPTEENKAWVFGMVVNGVDHRTIADILGISRNTLYKHYKEELEHSKARANAAIAGKLYQKAKNGCKASIFFWLKCQAGWREVQRFEIDPKGFELPKLTIKHIEGGSDE